MLYSNTSSKGALGRTQGAFFAAEIYSLYAYSLYAKKEKEEELWKKY